jgi:hypothetical protein
MMSAKLMKRRESPIQRAGRINNRDRDTVFSEIFRRVFAFYLAD